MNGCVAPHMNWPMASAKLTAAIDIPVSDMIGCTNSPVDWRAPVVMRMIAAEARISAKARREFAAAASVMGA